MPEWVMDHLTGNRMRRGTSAAQQVVSGALDTLVRETLQNSKDQSLGKGKPVKVRYSLIELTGAKKRDFLKAMDWDHLRKHLGAATSDPGATALRLRLGISILDSDRPLRCLRIEDFRTWGLEGDEFEDGKNFNLLCRSEFKTSGVGGRGGSHGLGKAVLWRFSEVATVLLSSLVNGLEKRGIRVFGRTDTPSHVLNGEEFTSGGWFGEKKSESTDVYAASIFGDKSLATSLQIGRASAETGTSALIVGFYEPAEDEARKLEEIAEDILHSSERWFWPSMMGGSKSSLEVEVIVERHGKVVFEKSANPMPLWEPFIRARQGAVTGAKAKAPGEVAETTIPFSVPAREWPVADRHPEVETELSLRVARGNPHDADHEKANCVAVFRGFEMVVKYVPAKRKPLDEIPFFGVMMAGLAAGSGSDKKKVEEFFRSSEPVEHNEWEYTEAVKHSYKTGGKVRLSNLWGELQHKMFSLVEEDVNPEEKGPELLSKMFPIGRSTKTKPPKKKVYTKLSSHDYLGGKWKIKGEVTHTPDSEHAKKPWAARIGFVAETDSGPGEYLKIEKLITSTKDAVIADNGPPALINVKGGVNYFKFEAVVSPSGSLEKRDLDLTAIRLAS